MKKRLKELTDSATLKERISYILAIASFIVGAGLVVAGFIVMPLGEIAGSTIGCAGMFLSFTGAVLGISFHYSYEEGKFKASVNETIEKRIAEIIGNTNEVEDRPEISEE